MSARRGLAAVSARVVIAACRSFVVRALQGLRRRTTAPARAADSAFDADAAADTNAADAASALRNADASSAVAEEPLPRRANLGRYRLDRRIGSGSMGVVYLGHDSESGQQVAIKTLSADRGLSAGQRAAAQAALYSELALASRLRHPDIVSVFEFGETDGVVFIVMEHVAGPELAVHAVAGRLLPVGKVLAIVERVARALAHAHRQGVVHRDIKPANLLLTDAASSAVKVTDFGIARVADARRTRTGLLLGSPAFMSPEQLTGRRLDGRSDLYSLGVVLFQLLTGALPHRAESIGRLLHEIANEAAPDVRSLRAELPEALANVVALALEKRPLLRYADGLQMADDLCAVARLMGTPIGMPAAPPDCASAAATPDVDSPSRDPADGSVVVAAAHDARRLDPGHNSGF